MFLFDCKFVARGILDVFLLRPTLSQSIPIQLLKGPTRVVEIDSKDVGLNGNLMKSWRRRRRVFHFTNHLSLE